MLADRLFHSAFFPGLGLPRRKQRLTVNFVNFSTVKASIFLAFPPLSSYMMDYGNFPQ